MPGMTETVFDRHAVRLHRDRAAHSVHAVRPVLQDAAERLLDRLDDTTRRFTRALDVGGRGVIAPLLRARGIEVVSCDLSARMATLNGGPCVAADEEWLPFAPGSFDPREFAELAASMDARVARYTSLVPTQLHRLVEAAEGGAVDHARGIRDAVRRLEAILVGGQATPPHLVDRAAAPEPGSRV